MTDEAKAKEYAKGLCKTCKVDVCRHSTIQTCAIKESLKQAYLDGLKAGKGMNVPTKLHDLRKDPTDVPKENVTVLLLTEVEPVTARYDNEYEAFFRLSDKLNYCVFIAPMSYIAWCEIPQYTEE